jgi:hypothetical protein
MKQYAEAAEAYQQAAEWGVTFPNGVYYNAACSYALIGETEPAFTKLHQRIPDLSDEQIWMEMQKIIVMLGDGHSGIRPIEGSRISFSKLPAQLYLFADGLFVIDADDESLIGARVISLGGKTPEELIEASAAIIPRDNMMGIRSMAPFILTLAGRTRRSPPVHGS